MHYTTTAFLQLLVERFGLVEISPFQKEYLPEAAALFVQNFINLRQNIPVLPNVMENADHVRQDDPKNSIWVATRDNTLAGYIRFEGSRFGAADIVRSETTIAITAAYTRPEYRGLGAAPQILNAAIQDYAQQGFECCSVDFESFNPEAATFWMKYFEPVCLSLIRVPEA